jgi:hypothetical protein
MKRSWNAGLWAGFVLVLLGVISYPLFFARFPVTRDFPWANFLIVAFALILIGIGVTRAFSRPDQYRGKVSGSILSVLALCVTGLFGYGVFAMTKHLPASHGAPRVGDMAPDFTLPDSKGIPVALSALIDSPFTPNGSSVTAGGSDKTVATVLIFYRGYW